MSKEIWNKAIVLLGTNLGDRLVMLSTALNLLKANNLKIIEFSRIYETAAWGLEEQPAFLNQVIKMETLFNPSELLGRLLAIENEMGRQRVKKWEQRCIDLDILFFNDDIIHETNLTVPHPYLHERRFTLIPVSEIIPEYIHPVFRKTINQLLVECKDDKMVSLF